MKDKTLIGGIVVMIIGAVLIGVVWSLFLNPAQTPTAPLQAIPVDAPEGGSYTIFEINPEKSEVSFMLDETLRGLPTTVHGYSQNLAGQIAVDFANPQASQIGPILINARTLLTDNEFRNNAIHSFILDSETYELITFMPTKINGLPAEYSPETQISIEIEGNLTIREITQPVVFTGTLSPNDSQIIGSATATINRADFELKIPEAPGVTKVGEEVKLSIQFTADLHQ